MISLNKPISSLSAKNKEENKLKIGQELVENMPIFTMKSDLENLSQSGVDLKDNSNFKQIHPKKTIKNIEKKSSSPFLSQIPIEKNEKDIPQKQQQIKKETKWEKIIIIGIICFSLLASGAGGYYYWISKQDSSNEITDKNTTETPKPIEEEAVSFSIEKPNYLPIDVDLSNETDIKETLKKYVKKVSASKTLAPVEFIVTDLKNNPVSFALFSSKLGINFSQDLLSSLNSEEKFSLFIYNDKENTRLGLAIDSKDDYKLKKSISQEEINIKNELEPLFLDVPYNSEINLFSSSSYNGTEIRYLNLISSNELTVDYTIFQNKLIIGTTKTTLRSIMDYIKNHYPTKTIPETANTPISLPENN